MTATATDNLKRMNLVGCPSLGGGGIRPFLCAGAGVERHARPAAHFVQGGCHAE